MNRQPELRVDKSMDDKYHPDLTLPEECPRYVLQCLRNSER